MDQNRRVYERLVRASLLIEEAKAQAMRAAHAAAKFRQCALNPTQLAGAVSEMQTALQRSAQCTQEASTLIKVA